MLPQLKQLIGAAIHGEWFSPSFVLSHSGGHLVDEPARLAQFVVELRRGELIGCLPKVVECCRRVLVIAT
jgi:uncharacterized membrane protein